MNNPVASGERTRPAGAKTMLAMVQHRYGPPDEVIRLATIVRPEIGSGEVLVKVKAAAVDRGTWHLTTGLPYPVRLAGYGFRAPKTPVRGMDLAGHVEEVGADVTTVMPGDAVFGLGNGTFAEYARCDANLLTAKPHRLSFEQAAALPGSGLTALQGLRDQGQLTSGQCVLVIGASGGVGSCAVQIAKGLGADVTGVCSGDKVPFVRSLGANQVIDYQTDDFADGTRRYDVILDTGGNASLGRLRRALAPQGILVLVGAETGGRWLGGTDRQIRAMIASPFIAQKLGTFIASDNREDLLRLAELVESGTLTPPLDRTYPLAELTAALRYLQDGSARGKVVVTV